MGREIGQARTEAAVNIMITAPARNISMLQFDRSGEIFGCGRKVAEENLPAILAGCERLETSEPMPSHREEQIKI
jgi:hypothetical protein